LRAKNCAQEEKRSPEVRSSACNTVSRRPPEDPHRLGFGPARVTHGRVRVPPPVKRSEGVLRKIPWEGTRVEDLEVDNGGDANQGVRRPMVSFHR
jgi:hypothetical protein